MNKLEEMSTFKIRKKIKIKNKNNEIDQQPQ